MSVARHQSFIASHLLGGFLALGVFPIYLAVVGRPSMISAMAFVWFLSPIAIAVLLSRTGRLGIAHLVSAANLTGLVAFAAALTGGITSFLVAWMIVVPLEAALSTERRIVLASIAIACFGLIGLGAGTFFELLPLGRTFAQDPAVLALLGSVSALVYAGGLAISVQIVHKQSEETIRTGEKRYRLLAENATDMITRHDGAGKVIFASLAAQQLLGATPRSLAGDGLFERIHVADRPAFRAALDRCTTGDDQASVEFRAKVTRNSARNGANPNDDFIWMEMRCRPVANGAGQDLSGAGGPGQIVAVTRDISERKIHEDAVLKARDDAESANLAKTQFLANMSHELRTPLNAIIGFSEILTRQLFGTLGDERYGEYARLIYESGEHLLNVVNEILDMSKIEAGKFTIVAEHFDAGALITSCSQIMAHQAEQKSILLKTDIAESLPELLADKRACKQMLLNLVSNAIKFTEDGGDVTVSARCSDGSMELSVADTGIGIAADDLPNLGNPFVQASTSYDRNYEGTGLGLSVVKGLARLHGGSFDISSELGAGTVVTIKLPVDGQPPASGEDDFDETSPIARMAVGG